MSSRKQEMLRAVDHLIRVHDDWERDREAPLVPPDQFAEAIDMAVGVCCSGEIPVDCHEIFTSVSRLGLEWEQYQSGEKVTRDQRPLESLWAAFRAVIQARRGAIQPEPRSLESVKQLREQKVSDLQIAKMYGVRRPTPNPEYVYEGPFFDEHGRVRHDLLDQEAESPGSVIGSDWVHPDEIARADRDRRQMEGRLQRLEQAEHKREQQQWEDPASIEDLIRQGQFPATIARVKNTTVEDVLQVAREIGLEPNSPDNPEPWKEPEPQGPSPQGDLEPGELDEEEIDRRIIEMYEDDREDRLSAGDIAQSISDEADREVSPQKVSAVIREWKKHQPAS